MYLWISYGSHMEFIEPKKFCYRIGKIICLHTFLRGIIWPNGFRFLIWKKKKKKKGNYKWNRLDVYKSKL